MPNRIKDIYALFAALTLLAVLIISPQAEASTAQDEFVALQDVSDQWRFRVYLDEKEIGYHHFYLAEDGANRQLKSVASFEYRLMFVTLFRYEHENLETWAGDCLQSVRSRTDSNGDNYTVHGLRFDGAFQVVASEGDAALPPCVMSFAYWNPAFLEESRLLNTQDGRYLEVEVSPPVRDRLEVRGEVMPTNRYHLEAGDLRLDLWYSDQNEWLALESTLESGRTLRYEPI